MQSKRAPAPDTFRALADDTRRGILEYLRTGPKTSGEIADQFHSSWPTISRHLAGNVLIIPGGGAIGFPNGFAGLLVECDEILKIGTIHCQDQKVLKRDR